jgi:hypothetical protein
MQGSIMTITAPWRLATLAICFCAGVTAAQAEDAGGTSEPPSKPAAETKTDTIAECISINADYQTKGDRISYVITLENKCEKRLKCEVFAYVVGAKGPSAGHAVLRLGAKSSGAAAKKSYAMKVKAAGGTANVSRDCKVF